MSPVTLQLTLPGYRITRWESNTLMRVYVEALEAPRLCPCCGGDRLHSKGRYERRVRHLACFGHPSELVIVCRRYECLGCQRSFVQPLPGIMPGRHSTEQWREVIYERHGDGICASVLAQRERMAPATVGRIYAQFTERKAKERLSLDCPKVLGIDEHTLHKGQRFATTFCDLKRHRVFDISPGRSEAELASYLRTLRGRDNVRVVCIALIIGGFILLCVDRLDLKPRYHEATGFTLPMYLGIGVCQCFSMIPGVSRAGATIVSAMLFGADRRSAAEFSFWPAMPTMVGAFAYEAFKDRAELAHANLTLIAVGFVCSFIFGWIVVKTFLGYVQRHSFALFAWWRIVVGAVGLLAIYFW